MKTAAAYVRVSTDDQLEYSPESQLKLIQEYAEKNDIVLLEDYIYMEDGGKSGKSMKNRTEFLKLIAAAKRKPCPFNVILVWKFSRFARNQEEAITLKSMLKKNGIDVISISEPLPEGPFGELIERILEWQDQFYITNLSQEVKRGMSEKVSRGEPVCAPPFGYDMKDGKYIPNADSAIVQNIFSDFLSGVGMRTIAIKYADAGMRTRYGNRPDNRYIEYILRNPTYIGKIRWSRDGRTVSRRKYDDPNIILVDGQHEPIIPVETFESAQARLNEIKSKYVKYQRTEQKVSFMLKGLVRCSSCGATLIATTTNGMQCHNYARGTCKKSHSITIDKLNAAVISYLESFVTGSLKVFPSFTTAIKSDAVDIDKLISNEQKKMIRIKKAYTEGIDTLEEYKQQKEAIVQKITELEKQKETAAEQTISEVDRSNLMKKYVSEVLATIKDETVSEQAKNSALRSIISKIVFYRPESRIEIYFHSNLS